MHLYLREIMPEKKMSVPEFKKRLEEFKQKQQKGKKVWKTPLKKHVLARIELLNTHIKSLEMALRRSKEFDSSTAVKPKPGTSFEKRKIVDDYLQRLLTLKKGLNDQLLLISLKETFERADLTSYLALEKRAAEFLQEVKLDLLIAQVRKKENDKKVVDLVARIKEIRERTRDHLKRPDNRVVVAILGQCAELIKIGRLRTAITEVMNLANEISNLNYNEFKKPLLFTIHDFFRWTRKEIKSEQRIKFIDRYTVEIEKYLKQAGATSNDILVRSIRPTELY